MTERTPSPEFDQETKDQLSAIARRIEVALWHGHLERVKLILKDAEAVYADAFDRKCVDLEDPVIKLGVPLKIANALEDHGIRVVGQLLWMPQAKFETISGLSERSWLLVVEKLRNHGYEHGVNVVRIRQLAKRGFKVER